MKKSSQWTLGVSLVLFLAAGTIKFWPEDHFLPTPTLASSALGGGPPGTAGSRSAAEMMPLARSFAPGWAESSAPTGRVADNAAFRPSPATPLTAPTAPRAGGAAMRTIPDDKARFPVSLAAQKMPVGEVLARLFHQAGVSFELTSQWDETMTITFSDTPMEQALTQTLQMTTRPRLSWHREKGVYIVKPVALLPPPAMVPQNTNPFR